MVSDQLHRKTYRVDLVWQLPREVKFLQQLAGYNGFPRVKGWDEEAVWMTHCGRSIKEAVKGGLSVGQVEDQLSVLLLSLSARVFIIGTSQPTTCCGTPRRGCT